jgi:hypothetical protein
MLAAAMTRVLDEAAWARKTYRQFFPGKEADEVEEADTSFSFSSSPQAALVRQCITKGAFTELRAACRPLKEGTVALQGSSHGNLSRIPTGRGTITRISIC